MKPFVFNNNPLCEPEIKGRPPEIGNIFKPKNTYTAFDNKEIKSIRHISTINEHLEGKRHPVTNVEYVKRVFTINGERVEGVFPKFDSKFDLKLPNDLRDASDTEQFKYCTKKLADEIKRNPELAKKFNARQLEQIKNGEPRISGLTWHHSEIPGKMQLVDSQTHAFTAHTGGRSIWGGGSYNR